MKGPLGLNKTANMKKSLFGRKEEGDGLSVAEKIMQKYGHKEGAGLGKMNQGLIMIFGFCKSNEIIRYCGPTRSGEDFTPRWKNCCY